jgi:adenosyl cobinamide kinase/adenosyl cobinamide phosphate guanylyltransferase
MVLNKTADERPQFPSAAALVNFEELPTSSKESRNRVTSTSRTRTDKQPIYVAKRPSPLLLARVRMTVDQSGHARVVHHRQKRSQTKRTDEERHHSSDTRCREQDPNRSLIQNLRQLASSLERSLDHRQELLPENVYGLIEDVRQLVKRAEKKALTTAFYGQPPRI